MNLLNLNIVWLNVISFKQASSQTNIEVPSIDEAVITIDFLVI
jgi:hypothetical protein